MIRYREILRLYSQGISKTAIAQSCECSRNTVSKVVQRAEEVGITWPLAPDLTDTKLQKRLLPQSDLSSHRQLPDYEAVHKELAKSGVTLSLLWNEYYESCRQDKKTPFMYTQFCKYYREYALQTKATMHIDHKPGEKMEVDWAGQTAALIDTDTGETIPAYIFVAVLSSSGYAYVEAFLSQNLECWITAHVHAYRFFGGVTRVLVPDNLKTGVAQCSWYTPVINKTYHEMAEHYGTAVIPARVRKPQDKAKVENTVGIVSTWILAALRRQQFFSLVELNQVIQEKLTELNRKPFQKKPGSRYSAFLEEENPALLQLPREPYELASWRIATVQFNYHISVDKMQYSVPYEYIKHKVDVRLTRNVVEVFFGGTRICSHPRLYGREGQYSTVTEHMPHEHRQYMSWDADRFLAWAEKIGPHAHAAVSAILASYKVEQQGYKSCMGLLKLADKYSLERLEAACAKALSYTPRPSYKSIQTILQTGQDKLKTEESGNKPAESEEFGFVRGADYYGRKRK